MRLIRRKPLSKRAPTLRCVPHLEALEDRTLPSADPLFGQFQGALGLLSLHGDSANHPVSASLTSNGFVQVSVANLVASSDPHAANYDPALAGATGQTVKAIQLDGSAADHLVLGNLNVTGGLSVQTDGVLDVQGQISAAGAIQLNGQTVLLSGAVRADGAVGGDITVTAGSVLQSGLLEADGSQGNGGSISVDFTGHYIATASSVTAASSTGAGGGGLVVIDGSSTGTLFSSGQYQANAVHGGIGGEIDLFAQQVHLVGANINASGWTGGGWVRVGGDSPADIAAHGGVTAGVSDADTTTVDATTTLTANALGAGNGGQIVVWSQESTTFGGSLAAQGAGLHGTGGLLEVSSAGQLTFGGRADATASSGQQGRLLLDPKNLIVSSGVGLPQFNLVNPSPSASGTFGASMVKLSNGNVVVTDPAANSYAGAVYLFDGQTGALLGTLTGSTSGDQVGSGGVTVLSNGNFVVSSPSWQDGGASVGAATWIDASTGFTASVSEANSIFGSTSGDEVGYAVTALPINGNYVVSSPYWQNGGAQVGAVTWGDGATGTAGAVDATNSLVGSTAGDDVGSDGVVALANGNYVVSSSFWQNPNLSSGGAVTWGNGAGGTVGPVTAGNSLVGDINSGEIGPGVTALSDGNYVVSSPNWQDADGYVGAATWGDGSTGIVGVVTAGNSLIGASTWDQVGNGGVKALTNGNYVVSSPGWQSGTDVVGAVTWCQAGGAVGVVSAGNSLVGSQNGDAVGSGGVTALDTGAYVVSSPDWQNGADVVGAVTWAAANGSTVGPVTTGNSLVGSTNGDLVGFGNGNPGSGVTALTNGNYVVSSPYWQDASGDVGAVTLGLADGSTTGAVSNTTSLVGSQNGDQVGSGGVTALSNGNYVVSSPDWQNGSAVVGAVTFSLADGSTAGAVTTSNSFVGATDSDQVGSGGVTVLDNGNYLISSPQWQQAGVQVGAVAWINGSNGQTLDSVNGPGAGALLGQVVGLQGGNAFLASFSGNGGVVTLVQLAATSEAFATAPTLTLTVAPSFLTATLDTGTDVVLQASNDIDVSSDIIVDNPTGNGGNLTLQAGRNILITANIYTDNGNLTLIANDIAADGVVDTQRGPGAAAITMTAGTSINAGTGDVSATIETGAGNSNRASDDITMGDITAHNVSLINNGPGDLSIGGNNTGGADMASVTATGDLTVQATFDISKFGALGPSDPGIISVGGATSLTTAGTITLDNQNIFGGTVTYNAPGQDVAIAASGNLKLASTTTAGALTASAGGNLSSSGPLAVSGAAALTGASITLTDSQNSFQGLVTLSSTGSIALTDSAALSLAGLTLAGSTTLTAPSMAFSALDVGAQTLTLTSTSAANLNGATTLAGGTISDSSGVVVGNGATLSGSGAIDGNLTLSSGSTLDEQIQSATQFGQLNVDGAISLGNATLQVDFVNPYQPAAYAPFQAITNVPGNAVTGHFAQGSTFAVGSKTLTIDYAAGVGNNVVLTVQGPAASVNSMPAYSSASFGVTWSGAEYALGATAYNVYVSDNGGPFTLWQSDTTQTSAAYTGQGGHTYGFFAVYTDDDGLQTPVAQATTTIKVTPTITWSNSADITFGTALSALQLDAAASTLVGGLPTAVPGTFAYTPAAGVVLGVGNSQTLNVTFTPTDTMVYATVSSSVVINVHAATPTFSNLSSPTIAYGTATTMVSGHLDGNAGSQSVPAAEIVHVTINGVTEDVPLDGSDNFTATFTNTASLNVTGSPYTIGFSYDGDVNFTSAVGSSSLTVSQAAQAITFNPANPVPYSSAPIALTASSGSGLTVTFTLISGPAVLNGNMLTITGFGSIVVEADQTGNANYLAALAVQRSMVVTTTYQANATQIENGTPTALTVSSLLGAHYTDPDGSANTKPGIAVIQTAGNGTWQYSANGATWIAVSAVTPTQALLLPGADSLRFVAATNSSGAATLDFVAWDGSTGRAATTANTIPGGDATAFSTDAGALTVTTNPIPLWVGTGAHLTTILPNTSAPAGDSVAAVFGAYFHDDNPAVTVGVAITSVTGTTSGAWQFSTNAGATWTNFPTVSITSALLLSASNLIRFVPKANFAGTVSLTALGWDGSTSNSPTPSSTAYSKTSLAATATIIGPTWTASTGAGLTPLAPGTYSTGNIGGPAGNTIASVFGSFFQDVNSSVTVGVAISALSATTGGTWQYSTNAGATWTKFPVVSTAAAFLLSATDQIRFVPNSTFVGSASMTAHAWDGSLHTHGTAVNLGTTGMGGATGFSTTTLTATAPINRAPTMSRAVTAPAVAVNATSPAITVASILSQAGYSDPDGAATPRGIALIGAVSTFGVGQYMLPHGTWTPLPNLSASSALLLPSTACLRFIANGQIGTATLRFDGWDQTQGVAGGTFNIAASGGATAFSAASNTLSIAVKRAPSWSAATGAALAPLLPGNFTIAPPAGNTVAAVFGSFFLDANLGATVGIAVTGMSGKGTWQFSTNGGTSWSNFSAPSKTKAYLLSANDMIRFVPLTNTAGAATLTAYAWDGSTGTHGTAVNLNTLGTGGASAFSATTLTATCVVNTAPTLNATQTITLNAVAENVTSPAAMTVSSLLAKANYHDADGVTAPSGIAITSDAGPGSWQWLNGTTWTALPSIPNNSAFLLASTTQLRFKPADNLATNTNGSATLTYLGWDKTAGAANSVVSPTSAGGTSAFSTQSASAAMAVNFVKQSPAWSPGIHAAFTPVLGFSASNAAPSPAGDTVASIFGNAFLDAQNIPVGIAITALGGTSVGAWQYSTDGVHWTNVPAVSMSAALLLSANDKLRFVPSHNFSGTVSLTAYAWDGTGVFTNSTANLTQTHTGGTTPFSPTALAATCLVNSAPDLQ